MANSPESELRVIYSPADFVPKKAVAVYPPCTPERLAEIRASIEAKYQSSVAGEHVMSDGTVYFELANGDAVLPYVGGNGD